MDSKEEEFCPDAYKNPTCPYIADIHASTAKISRIEKALVGEDMQSGLVAKVHQLEVTQKILVALGSASLAGLIGLAIFLFERLVAN
jgi:hypothetical protein